MNKTKSSSSPSTDPQWSISEIFPKRRQKVHPKKSYDNIDWMHGRSARHVRILCEYLEVQERLQNAQVMFSILVFGSARSYSREVWDLEMKRCETELEQAYSINDTKAISDGERRKLRLSRIEKLCIYWDKTRSLTNKIMTWFQTQEAREALAKILEEVPSLSSGPSTKYFDLDVESIKKPNSTSQVAICTGGGMGLMEAANKGAHDVPGARSMGMGISLPFEPGLNGYVDPDLAFEFHYFFTRKFWMAYLAIGLIAVPGGFGTLDELMELLTLKQTGKLKRDIPVVLLGKDFWEQAINFNVLVDYGTISEQDKEQLFITDDPEEAFQYFKSHILADKLILGNSHVHKSKRQLKGSGANADLTFDINI